METRKDIAARFIITLTGVATAPATVPLDWATFADDRRLKPAAPTLRIRGTLDQVWDRLVEANAQGSGIFLTINESDGRSFLDASIVELRACFIDDDGSDPPVTFESLKALGLAPAMTVQARRGQHNYWLLSLAEGEDLSDFTPLQKALAKKFGTDKAVSNLGRVMRVPGFFHQKKEPYLVTIVQIDPEGVYTIGQVVDAFKILPSKEPAPKAPKAKPSMEGERVKRARAYVETLGPAVEGAGGDQHTFKVAAALVRDYGLDDDRALEIFREWNASCKPPWSDNELRVKLSNARSYGKGDIGSKVWGAGGLLVPAEGEYRPTRPAWTNEQFAADKGPLVHFIPGKSEDEWIQSQPTGQMIANAAKLLVHYCDTAVVSHPGLGSRYYEISAKNIATPTTRELLMPDVRDICVAMMAGFAPTPETFTNAEQQIRALPRRAIDLAPMRWEGETRLTLHEIPLPKEGDWSAHKEFIDRCSCPDTIKAWVWTCFLPEDQTGREALLLFGHGYDGKSDWARILMEFLGPLAASSEILKGEQRFELANLINKRLAYFGDFRNPKPIHSKIMREIISGAYLYTEGKGKDGQSVYFHPRVLMTTNVEPRITMSDRAEYTRVRRVNVQSLEKNLGDKTWPRKLLSQMPAFLFECRRVYTEMVTEGRDLPITDACREALRGGEHAMAEDFDYLSERLEVTGLETDYITSAKLIDLMDKAHYKEWVRKDAYRWLRSLGATNRAETGGDLFIRPKGGRSMRIWRGIKDRTGTFNGIGTALVVADKPPEQPSVR